MDSIDSFDFSVTCDPHGAGKWDVKIKWLALSHVKAAKNPNTDYVLAETSVVVNSEGYPDDELYEPQVFNTFEYLLTEIWVADAVTRHNVYSAEDSILNAAPDFFTGTITRVFKPSFEYKG